LNPLISSPLSADLRPSTPLISADGFAFPTPKSTPAVGRLTPKQAMSITVTMAAPGGDKPRDGVPQLTIASGATANPRLAHPSSPPRASASARGWQPTIAFPVTGSPARIAQGSMATGSPVITLSPLHATGLRMATSTIGTIKATGRTNEVTLASPHPTTNLRAQSGSAIVRADPFFTHVAQRGETIATIARKFKVPANLIVDANIATSDHARLKAGQAVRVPRKFKTLVNGKEVVTNVRSYPTISGGPVAPFRAIVEGVGGKVNWAAQSRTVHANAGKKTIRLKIGDQQATVNEDKVMLDLAAFLFSGRTMVPASFFKEAIDATVVVDPETGSITVSAPVHSPAIAKK